jgi:hypothetical protein
MWRQRILGSCWWQRKGLRTLAENAAEGHSAEELSAQAGPRLRDHLAGCAACRMLLQDSLEGRDLMRAAYRPTKELDSGFARRVMATIRSLEAERSSAANLWVAVQTLATRVAWVAALVLLVASGWLYQQRTAQAPPASGQDYTSDRFLEPAPQVASPDDALASLGEGQE